MNEYKAQYPIIRSLIQKAVRRGHPELVEQCFNWLIRDNQQKTWLRSRVYVIAFEDCADYIPHMEYTTDLALIKNYLLEMARSNKNKEICGIGSVVYQILHSKNRAKDVKLLEHLISDNEEIKKHIIRLYKNTMKLHVKMIGMSKAELAATFSPFHVELYKKIYLEWDKIFLSAKINYYKAFDVPSYTKEELLQDKKVDLNLGIAIDKHTAIGKEHIKLFCSERNINYFLFGNYLFYTQGSVVNHLNCDYFWSIEKEFSLNKYGFDLDKMYSAHALEWLKEAENIFNSMFGSEFSL